MVDRPGLSLACAGGALGEEAVGAHGPSEMPVWGLSFIDRSRAAEQRDEVEATVEALVRHLHTLQQSARRR